VPAVFLASEELRKTSALALHQKLDPEYDAEFAADRAAALATGKPDAAISLFKQFLIQRSEMGREDRDGPTHPRLSVRIQRLEALKAEMAKPAQSPGKTYGFFRLG